MISSELVSNSVNETLRTRRLRSFDSETTTGSDASLLMNDEMPDEVKAASETFRDRRFDRVHSPKQLMRSFTVT